MKCVMCIVYLFSVFAACEGSEVHRPLFYSTKETFTQLDGETLEIHGDTGETIEDVADTTEDEEISVAEVTEETETIEDTILDVAEDTNTPDIELDTEEVVDTISEVDLIEETVEDTGPDIQEDTTLVVDIEDTVPLPDTEEEIGDAVDDIEIEVVTPECRTAGDCLDIERCTEGTCTLIICAPEHLCQTAKIVDHECVREDSEDCCLDSEECAPEEFCDANVCTLLECDDSTECIVVDVIDHLCVEEVLPNGVLCGDMNSCNGIESCQDGFCTSGALPSCDDLEPCTLDACDAVFGCVHERVFGGDCPECLEASDCPVPESTCQADRCVKPDQALWCWDEGQPPSCHTHGPGIFSPFIWKFEEYSDDPPHCQNSFEFYPDPRCCIAVDPRPAGNIPCVTAPENPYEE